MERGTMRNTWLDVLDRVLRPARPDLGRCLAIWDLHRAVWRPQSDDLTQQMTRCEERINTMRADVFATNDGIVGRRMTELEREWRTLQQRNADLGVMDLWARMAPAS